VAALIAACFPMLSRGEIEKTVGLSS
jgi:hypothetical protein